jgi:acyl-CoA synthetase (NDP forming)
LRRNAEGISFNMLRTLLVRFLEASRAIKKSGRTVVLYRAGRTQEGVEASASHTAAIAGDYTLTRELARHAGVVVCDSTDDFEDLVKLFALLADKEVRGMRLGAVSNAGFESVAVADRLGGFTLPDFSAETQTALQDVLGKGRIDRIVDVRNPMDITPMSEDAAYEEAIRWVMGDDNVDVGFVGCVPLTAALNTLPPGTDHPEDVYGADSIARRLINLKDESPKAWVAAVDGGRDYDAMATLLEENGVPTFRTADRALRLFARFCEARMKASADRRNRT